MTSRYLKQIDKIVDKLLRYYPQAEVENIYKAFHLANNAHKHDFRKSGDPYIEHPVMVASILSEMNVGETTLIAALLHDTVEDTSVSNIEIEEKFGKEVALIVDGVTKISEIHFESLEQKQAENYRKLIISMAKDLRIMIIKFADRLHNMRTIKYMKPAKQIQKARETLEVFAPLAHMVGMFQIKSELEDRAFAVLQPEKCKEIEDQLDLAREDYYALLDSIVPQVEELLSQAGVTAKVNGRVKHLYSIYRKLQTRKKSMAQIKDILAIRIILDSDDENLCFDTMRLIHRNYQPVENEFSNFIDNPRENGYKSLHSKIIFLNRVCEVQVRTAKMHEIAEFGLAAHWRYKEEKHDDSVQAIEKYIDRVKTILNNSFSSDNPEELLEDLKINVNPSNEVFVFTISQEAVYLPADSTPVDFAYYLHEDIGNHCIAAKISGVIYPLDKKLENGSVVEIITSKNQRPSYEWLKFTKLHKARKSIKRYLRKNQFTRTIALGKEILESELKKYELNLDEDESQELANSFGLKESDELFWEVGSGKIRPRDFLRKVVGSEKDAIIEKNLEKVKLRTSYQGVRLNNIGDKNISFCSTCNPLPGDAIISIHDNVSGIVVHRINCSYLRKLGIEKEDHLDVFWDVDKDEYFETKICIIAENRRGLLKDIISVLSKSDLNLHSVQMQDEAGLATGEFLAEVKNLTKYIKIRKEISSIKGVVSVSRSIDLHNS